MAVAEDIKEQVRTEERIKERASRNKRLKLGITSQRVTDTENVFDSIPEANRAGMDKATVSHKSDPIIIMYGKMGDPRRVPEGSVRVCLQSGLHLECPICKGEHEDAGECPELPDIKFRRCPVCGKRFPDDRADPLALDADEPGLIPTDLPGTPEARTQAKMEAHLVVYHEEAARRAGLLTAAQATGRK